MSIHRPGDWTCPDCGDHCFASRKECRCGKWKPRTAAPAMQTKPGDWQCDICNGQNFARRRTCFKCGVVNPAAPATPAAEQRQGDWTCSGCAEHNFASRRACRKCGEPKQRVPGKDCAVCMDDAAEWAGPCLHVCMCFACSRKLERCPICMKVMAKGSVKRVFIC